MSDLVDFIQEQNEIACPHCDEFILPEDVIHEANDNSLLFGESCKVHCPSCHEKLEVELTVWANAEIKLI